MTEFLKVFRFKFKHKDTDVSFLFRSAKWEGKDLILTRAIRKDEESSLFWELHKLNHTASGNVFYVEMYDEDHKVIKKWELTYQSLHDRGFCFLDAMEGVIAKEAVMLCNAEMFEVGV